MLSVLSKGLDRNRVNNKKEKITRFCIPKTLLKKIPFGITFVFETKKVKNVNINIHNNIDPSRLPHKPEIL